MDSSPVLLREKVSLISFSLVFHSPCSVCRTLDSLIDAGTPPDLVLDLTRGGDASQIMKIVTANLGLPSITSGQGEIGDLWGWRSLSPGQEEYLVQVRSPSDLLPYVMKDLALATEMKHVAVLYDDTFCKNY